MKKSLLSVITILLSIMLLTACTFNSAQTEKNKKNITKAAIHEATFPITIKDGTGKEIKINQKPKRIISILPSNTEIAYKLGLGKEIVGVSDYDTYPKDVKKKEKVGGMDPNIEKIISLKPDLVLADQTIKGLNQLKDAGLKVLVTKNAQNFEQVYDNIDMIGDAAGKEKEAGNIITGMKKDLGKIEKKAETIPDSQKKKVFIEVSPAPDIYTTGKNTFMQEMLDIIHAQNVAKDQQGWVKMSDESIIQLNPDVILTTYGYYVKNPVVGVLSQKGWENVKAIKNKQVFDVNSELVNRPGPRLVEGVEELAKAVYPKVFAK